MHSTEAYTMTIRGLHQEDLQFDIKMVKTRAVHYVMSRNRTQDSLSTLLQELSCDTLEQRRHASQWDVAPYINWL